ncbi:MAG: hypothetical protein AABY32_05990 [Nanoarchaeota archaeon]
MKKQNMSKKDMISDITTYIINLKTPLYLSNDDKTAFKIKDVINYLPVILGLYDFSSDEKALDPEMSIEQCTIYPTTKGREIYAEYRRLKSN